MLGVPTAQYLRSGSDVLFSREGSLRDRVRQRVGGLKASPTVPEIDLDSSPVIDADVVLGNKRIPDQSVGQVDSMARTLIRQHLEDRALNGNNPISAPDVLKSYENVLDVAGMKVPIRSKLRKRGIRKEVEGFFKVSKEVIRLREALDIPTAAHEAFHALEKGVFGWRPDDVGPWSPDREAGIPLDVQKELAKLGHDLYGDQTPTGGYLREGWAEFGSFWLAGMDSHLEKNAPNVLKWFNGTFLVKQPEIAQALKESRTLTVGFYEQGAIKRARSGVVTKPPNRFLAKVRNTLRPSELNRMFIDELSPLQRVTEVAETLMGLELPISANPYLSASALAKTHTARARYMVDDGMIDFAGNVVGGSLQDAVQIVLNADVRGAKSPKEKREAFTIYLWARRALKLWQPSERFQRVEILVCHWMMLGIYSTTTIVGK